MTRILLINPNTTASITDNMIAYLRSAMPEPVDFVGVTGRFGARYISNRASVAIAGHAALDAMASHVAGCDVVYLACFGDPGLLALKELSPVPVIGMAEAACLEAAQHDRRFSIVTGGSAWQEMLTEFVQGTGLSAQLASIRPVSLTGDRIAGDPAAAIPALAAACNECLSLDGADVIVLGGAAMAGLASRLQPLVPVPIICSVLAGARGALRRSAKEAHAAVRADGVASVGLSPALADRLAGSF